MVGLEKMKLKWILFTANAVGLVILSMKASAALPGLHTYLFRNADRISTLYTPEGSPFETIGIQMDFYKPDRIQLIRVPSLAVLSEELQTGKGRLWFYYHHFELPEEAGDLRQKCRMVYSVFPRWLKVFWFLPGVRQFSNKSSIFECHR